ncbi:hypothetical protein N9Q05_00710, partial [bacterium]|nr:hypothetical protein [bacterium]
MPVKRYTVDGEPYDVSDAKEQEFLSKFDNAVLVGVLDEETNEVIEQKIDKVEDKEVDFPTAVATEVAPVTANTNAVQQPMTELQAGYVKPEDTVLPSVDTSLDSPDPDPDPDSPDDSTVLDEIVIKAKTKSKKEKVNEIFQENIYNDFSNPNDEIFRKYAESNNSILFPYKENLKNGPQADDIINFLNNNPGEKVSIFIDNPKIPDYKESVNE